MSNTPAIVSLSRKMWIASLGGIILIPLATGLLWAGVPVAQISNVLIREAVASSEFGLGQRLLGFSISMIPQIPLLYGLTRLASMFQLFYQGAIFEPPVTGHLRAFAAMLVVSSFLSILNGIPMDAMLTWVNGPGQRQVTIGIGGSDLEFFFLSGLFYAIAWVLSEAHNIAEDNAQIL